MAKKSIISVDMGGTKILAALINSTDGITHKLKVSTDRDGTSDQHTDSVASLVKTVLKNSETEKNDVAAVCIGVPGTVNPHSGLIGKATNIKMENYNIKTELEKRVSIPVIVENDVNLGALGIKKFGVGKESKNLLAVFVGTGIGGGLIIDEKIYRGSYFNAGEIGHTIVDENGKICNCGKRGCFETIASRKAIVDQITEDVKNGAKSFLAEKIINSEKVKSKALAAAVVNNDTVTISRITVACKVIGKVLANISNLVNIDTIVLGGGMVNEMSSYLLPIIRDAYHHYVYGPCGKDVIITASELGDDAPIWGGVALAEEFLGIKV